MEQSITKRWYNGQQIDGVKFNLNDDVHILAGPKTGQHGNIISLEKIDPEPLYLVEDEQGSDSILKQSEMEEIK